MVLYHELWPSRTRELVCPVPARGASYIPTVTVTLNGTTTFNIPHSVAYKPPTISSFSPTEYPGAGPVLIGLVGMLLLPLLLTYTYTLFVRNGVSTPTFPANTILPKLVLLCPSSLCPPFSLSPIAYILEHSFSHLLLPWLFLPFRQKFRVCTVSL